jgi:hypothetical protein
LTSISEDPLRKHVKLDRAAGGEASSLANVSRNNINAHVWKIMLTQGSPISTTLVGGFSPYPGAIMYPWIF